MATSTDKYNHSETELESDYSSVSVNSGIFFSFYICIPQNNLVDNSFFLFS